MYNFNNYLSELSENSGVPFKIIKNDGTIIFHSTEEIEKAISRSILFGNEKVNLILDNRFEICTSLLKYSIESKFKEIYDLREQLIIDILEGKAVNMDALYGAFPFLNNKCTLFIISVEKNKYEALNILKESYNDQEFTAIIYKNYIVILGNFDEILDHARGIKELIFSNLYVKPYISYSYLSEGIENLKEIFENSVMCINLGKKYGLKSTIYNSESLLFEKIVYNINDNMKKEIFNKFNDKLIKFDNEMINTIQELMNCGLNISEAAKKLYIHRNTLIYRLDKIQKDTGYDIRDFKQATIFTIAFLIWKENNNEY